MQNKKESSRRRQRKEDSKKNRGRRMRKMQHWKHLLSKEEKNRRSKGRNNLMNRGKEIGRAGSISRTWIEAKVREWTSDEIKRIEEEAMRQHKKEELERLEKEREEHENKFEMEQGKPTTMMKHDEIIDLKGEEEKGGEFYVPNVNENPST
jgi:hypothetical protein